MTDLNKLCSSVDKDVMEIPFCVSLSLRTCCTVQGSDNYLKRGAVSELVAESDLPGPSNGGSRSLIAWTSAMDSYHRRIWSFHPTDTTTLLANAMVGPLLCCGSWLAVWS